MVPTLKDNQILLLNKLDYKLNKIERYDIVVVKVGKSEIIKRVIGLPGENIEYRNNTLYINGHEVETDYNFETEDFTLNSICNCDKIPENKYLVLGDNRKVSIDSRNKDVGLVKEEDILGKTVVRFWPINKISLVK